MPQSYDRIVLHTTFGTKFRQPWIDEKVESEMHIILAEALRKFGCVVHEIGGTADHIHMVHTLPRTKCMADIMRAVKAKSSGWIKTKGEQYEWFKWQDGYATFSVDYRKMDGVLHYVRNQKQHHGDQNSKMSFVHEFTRLMNAYGFPNYTKQYVFPEPPNSHTLKEPRLIYGRKDRRLKKRWKRRRNSIPTSDPEGRLA